MTCRSHAPILAVFAVFGMLLSACSGGGLSSDPSTPGKGVYWTTPQYYTDNTPLDPSDLRGFEIYIKQDPSPFGPADNPVATTSSRENFYPLEHLTPPLTQGVTYYVSLKTVTIYDKKSDFSPPVSFSL